MPENKGQFGLDSLYYAVITDGTDGAVTFGTPVRIPGAVSLSMDAENGDTTFYADNIKYFVSTSNNGYSGSVEVAKIPESMWSDVFGATEGSDGVLVENVSDTIKDVALLFRFSGDKNKNCCVLYRCTIGRPSRNHNTTTDTTEPETETLEYTAVPLADGKLRATTTSETADTIKNSWFTQVYTG